MAFDVKEAEAYIRQAAKARGIDPDVAVRVARSEGLARDTWQSRVVHPTRGREPSYGPFQLLVGGENGWPTGMGNAFEKATGLKASDPANWRATVDFGLDTAAKEGWAQWYGPKNVGIGRWDGVRGAKPIGLSLATNKLGPGDTRAPIPVEPGGNLPSLVDRGSIGDAPVVADKPFPEAPAPKWGDVQQAFANEGFMAGMGTLGKTAGAKQGLGLLANAFGGGGQSAQQREHETPIVSNLAASMTAEDSARMATARQMMSELTSARKKKLRGGRPGVPGLSLMG